MTRVALVLLLALVPLDAWKVAVPDYDWSFPRDHWAHEGYRTEWWYFTGQVATASGRRFGYQFTFFRVGVARELPELQSNWASGYLVMGHAAVTDIDAGRHVFSELLYREMPLLASFAPFPSERIGWSRAPAGTDDVWYIDWNGDGFDFHARDDARGLELRFETHPLKPRVFHGPNGFSRKSGGSSGGEQASQYYSFTRLETSGEIRLDGERFEVTGESWMDKEFSSTQLSAEQVGWDWFSLKLDDGRELMLYLMRRADGSTDFANATLVSAEGNPRYLSPEAFSVEALAHWESPATGARYPSRWRVRFEGEAIEIDSLVDDQENRSRLPGGVFYWEGAVDVTGPEGASIGKGFVELVGYGEGNRPPV